MANASTAGVTAPMTPPHGVGSGPESKSTPLRPAAVSEYIIILNFVVRVASTTCRSLRRDVENYGKYPVDKMLQELLYRCVDRSKPFSDKPTLLDDRLKVILPNFNKGNDTQKIKQHLGDLMASTVEEQMYKPFIQASNLALDLLSKLDVPGLVCSKAHDDDKILFHQNDPKKWPNSIKVKCLYGSFGKAHPTILMDGRSIDGGVQTQEDSDWSFNAA
ncbi:hypothetical protein CY34DRAFT_13019 [Suillus luteus UH-Slu-Lm8-n1]|uniref:Uncharacterized protein n=1 Tax=Suillus luteus UH-Slu-Lm8-n1 TaxID=930992 RepID=A0A0D0BDY0_9AGAM|nr:hypothetical protein CY34DRAFT_13019 [Suillus luteus UH-Slu-Lm8-n1]